MNTRKDIVNQLRAKYQAGDFVVDKTGAKLVEILGASFIADDYTILGTLNKEYADAELSWFISQSRDVRDIPYKLIPKVWRDIADKDHLINSNYGWCALSEENHSQYDKVLAELKRNPFSRRTSMIYTRPTMHEDAVANGMSDFICTYGVDFFIRSGRLHSVVHMRSLDVVYGYKADYYWHKWVMDKLSSDLGVEQGDILWFASSAHLYERHFKLLEE